MMASIQSSGDSEGDVALASTSIEKNCWQAGQKTDLEPLSSVDTAWLQLGQK